MANPENRDIIANGVKEIIQYLKQYTKQGLRERAERCALISTETSPKLDPDPSKEEELRRQRECIAFSKPAWMMDDGYTTPQW